MTTRTLVRDALRGVAVAVLCVAPALAGCRRTPPPAPSAPFAWPAAPAPSSGEFEAEIRAFEAEDAKSPPRPGEVLFVGSSSIRLWGSLAEDFKPHPVKNRGFGGAHIRDVIDFGRRMIVPYAPPRIVFFAGTNDLHDGATPPEVLADFRTFVAGIHEVLPATRIAFVSITTSPSRFSEVTRVREANRLIAEYVASDPKLTFIDVFPLTLDAAGRPRPELFRDDRLHMNRQGYALWVPRIAPFVSATGD